MRGQCDIGFIGTQLVRNIVYWYGWDVYINAEIREVSATIKNGDIPDWVEGWEEVQKAIRKHGMYDIKGAMDSFSPLTRQTVERLGFRNICVSENPMADRANFRQCYEILANREQTRQQVALPLQDVIKQIQTSGFMMLEDGGE